MSVNSITNQTNYAAINAQSQVLLVAQVVLPL